MCTRDKLIQKYINIDSKMRQEKKEILDKLKGKNALHVADHIVTDSNLCIILSCPGEEELMHDNVCFGETGNNLNFLLNILTNDNNLIKGGTNSACNGGEIRYNFSIFNASNKVYFREYNEAEAPDKEILSAENTKRLEEELKQIQQIDYFILCGGKAKLLHSLILSKYQSAKISLVCHLGNVGIRNEYKNQKTQLKNGKFLSDIEESKRDEERLKIIADKIMKDFSND